MPADQVGPPASATAATTTPGSTTAATTTPGSTTPGSTSAVARGGTAGGAGAVVSASDRGARIAAVVIAYGWHLLISLPAVLLSWSALRWPWLVGGGWLAVAAAGGFAGWRLLRGGPLPAWPLVVGLLLVDAVVFPASGAELLFHSANWGWGTVGWFAVLFLWGRPLRDLVATIAAGAVIALVAVLGQGADAADLSRYAMYVYGVAALPIAFAVGAATLRALAAERARAAAAGAAVTAERLAAAHAHRDRLARLALVDAAAGAVLADLAAGRADPTDPAVQRRCALAAARLRRLIAESDDVPDPLLHELRAGADLAERRGVAVDLITLGGPPPLPVEVRRRLVDPLTAALAQADDRARLTVLATPDAVEISLVTPDRGTLEEVVPASGDGPVEYEQERDGEVRWIRTRWTASR
ncbi:hypothetical protein O7606_25995 [Micromonospora sp. WMMD882]|uniref:hypothetical protein n=1 Tax=Micromonospora sp. WMMD882 TaxID=3015151 RepID=UPI00248C405A|nr:hypothetical protein [Micromonospora sp. WMMD882]WBB79560.1 hypothetical protein O7606_25995 [Micromonospora sp. WMMD882]